ncbi:MAG: lipoyl(octanoyl) transferase LipB [Gemmatimonadota bacterium]|nr:lipoyl(octanoyl) transferase LipB [Gemmatimonadota bacterium]
MTHDVRELVVRRLGTLGYAEALEVQAEAVQARRAGRIPDTLLLVEHPHVITLGSGANAGHVLLDPEERERRGIELFETGRGGDVTYHGPGQLVAYPILDLKPDRKDLHAYLRDLEAVVMEVVERFGVAAERSEGQTGVWTAGGKIAAIGVRVSSGWITSHGLALNVATDLSYFGTIVPCGIADRDVTSLARELGRDVTVEEAAEHLVSVFARHFGHDIRTDELRLAERPEGQDSP